MAWHRVGVCYQLRSPLHVGYEPNRAGVTVTARTRFYVPGRTVWGAMTVALAHQNGAAPNRSDYLGWGKKLRESARFSHFFVCDDDGVFAPSYGQVESDVPSLLLRDALHYGPLSVTQFRRRFVRSRMSTQIGVCSGSAVDQTLHETELLLARQPGTLRPVYVIGAFWFREDLMPNLGLTEDCQWLTASSNFAAGPGLILGGDRRYGMGEAWLADPPACAREWVRTPDRTISRVRPDPPACAREWVSAHLPTNPDVVTIQRETPLMMPLIGYSGRFTGERELLARRSAPTDDSQSVLSAPGKSLEVMGTSLAPGTILFEETTACLNADGLLRVSN